MSYVIAAEAARYLGNAERAAEFLRKGREQHPDDPILLNNLVYMLSLQQHTVQDALGLVPELRKKAGKNPQFLDTLALVYLRSAQFDKVIETVSRILLEAGEGTPCWFRGYMYIAEVALRNNDSLRAEAVLKKILRRSRGVSTEDILAARKLMTEAGSVREEQERAAETNAPGRGIKLRRK